MQSRSVTLEPNWSWSPGCPSDEDLLAYLPGSLLGPLADSIAEHLATCPACRVRVSTLQQRLSGGAGPQASPAAPADQEPKVASEPATTIAREVRPRPPQRLGDYELLSPIGRGGMGLVYRARHVRLQRMVAVKVLPNLHLADDSAVVRMRRETAAAGRVQHENIVYATDAGEQEGVHYLVMELVAGIDLSRLVAVHGPLPLAESCEIIRQASLGLIHIAECGLVHRDLKPSNIMLTGEGTVKILDLGLARLHLNPIDDGDATQAGYLLGTADYVAPEQIESPHDADVRSDLYSLGCTFYKLLTGSAPFSGPDLASVSRKVEAHRRAPPPPIRSMRPEVPEDIEQLLTRLLAKRPADRLARPEELAAALVPHARGADLPALLRRTGALDAQTAWPTDPEQGHASTNATTQTLLRDRAPRPKFPWHIVALVAMALVTVTIGALALSRGSGNGTRPDKIQAYDLTVPLSEIVWTGYVHSRRRPQFDEQRRMLQVEVEPNSYQLIELGQYDGRPGTFTATISQSAWHGDAGLFFGCRPEQREQRDLTTFQLFVLEYFPAVGEGPGGVEELFRVRRERAFIGVNPISLQRDLTPTPTSQVFDPPAGSQLQLAITFGLGGCERVMINGQPLADLSSAALNGKYLREDYVGTFGLYCAGGGSGAQGGGPSGPTWFGNVVFTSAE